MRRVLAICVALLTLGLATGAAAAVTTPGGPPMIGLRWGVAFPPSTGGGGGGYTGPCDLVSCADFWGPRAASAAAAAAQIPAINLAHAADSETCDVKLATSGDLATTVSNCNGLTTNGTSLTTWCAGACTGNTLYGQINGLNATYSGDPPVFDPSCTNGKPCFRYSGSGGFWMPSSTNVGQALSISAVAMRSSGSTTSMIFGGSNGVYFAEQNRVSGWFGAQPVVNANDGDWHALQFTVNGNQSAINVDGADSTGADLGTGDLTAPFYLGRQNGGSYLTGGISEVLLAGPGVAFSPAQRTSLCHNDAAWYGITATC
jgi:hypothetical protein